MSFRFFIIGIILLMIITGIITLTDRWGASVEETTGPDEQRSILLATGIRINLAENTRLLFRKGAWGKFMLEGKAEFNMDNIRDGARISVETRDVLIKTKNANFKVNVLTGETLISVQSGSTEVFLKPDSKEIRHLNAGEEFSYRLPQRTKN